MVSLPKMRCLSSLSSGFVTTLSHPLSAKQRAIDSLFSLSITT
jgi:hypothetical protein